MSSPETRATVQPSCLSLTLARCFRARRSLGVFAGGCIWSWIYLRYRDIWGAWVSHVLADIIIFIIGYQLIFGGQAAG